METIPRNHLQFIGASVRIGLRVASGRISVAQARTDVLRLVPIFNLPRER